MQKSLWIWRITPSSPILLTSSAMWYNLERRRLRPKHSTQSKASNLVINLTKLCSFHDLCYVLRWLCIACTHSSTAESKNTEAPTKRIRQTDCRRHLSTRSPLLVRRFLKSSWVARRDPNLVLGVLFSLTAISEDANNCLFLYTVSTYWIVNFQYQSPKIRGRKWGG